MPITDATRRQAEKLAGRLPDIEGLLDDLLQGDTLSDNRSIELFDGIPRAELRDRFNTFRAAVRALADGTPPNPQAIADGLSIVKGEFIIASNVDEQTVRGSGPQNLKDRHAFEQGRTSATATMQLMLDIAEDVGVPAAAEYRVGLGFV